MPTNHSRSHLKISGNQGENIPPAFPKGQANRRSPQPVPIQLFDLIRIQLSNWRWSWQRMLITGALAPLMSMLALGIFARDSGPETLVYVLTGNITLALMFENLGKVTSNFSFMRFTGALYHFATLPIKRYTLILATVISFFVLSLPALLITTLVGSSFLDVPLKINPLIIVVIPLVTTPLAGIGALIGSSARSPEEAGSTSLILTLLMLGLGPVVIPPERLPDIMVTLGYLSPATYAASALRQTLIGPVTGRIALDLGALLIMALLAFRLVSQRMNWRQG